MPREVRDDQLLTLEHAAEIFLGDRKRVSTLRAEFARGNLKVSKIGRSYWTTLARLREMDAKCLVEAQGLGSGTTKSARPSPSSTVDPDIARGAALRTLAGLKESFRNTSKCGTSPPLVKRRLSRT